MKKIAVFIFLFISIIAIILTTGCTSQSNVVAVNVYSFSDAIIRVSLYDNNQLTYEKISSDGTVKILKFPYSYGELHSIDEATAKGIIFDGTSSITNLSYIDVDAKEPWYLIETTRNSGRYILFGLSSNGKAKTATSAIDAPIEVYVFGTGTYSGTLGYTKDGKYSSTTVESSMPGVHQLFGNINQISLAFQNGNEGAMTVLIYDTGSGKILNSGSTKAVYGVVSLTN